MGCRGSLEFTGFWGLPVPSPIMTGMLGSLD